MKCKNHYNIKEKNPMYGKKHNAETIMKMKLKKMTHNNPMWQDQPNYAAVHVWINRNHIKPKLCEYCNKVSKLDLANITGIYNRDLKNWKYLCRKCHIISDNRINNLKQFKHLSGDL